MATTLDFNPVSGKLDLISDLDNAMQFKGAIDSNDDFPTSSEVQNGWVYRITADVTDDDATKTNTSQSFLEDDEIAWNGSDWTVLGNAGGSSVSFGTQDQIPYMNAAGDDFDYSSGLVYDDTSSENLLLTAQASTHTPLVIQGASSQSVPLLEFENNSGTTLTHIDEQGFIRIGNEINSVVNLSLYSTVVGQRIWMQNTPSNGFNTISIQESTSSGKYGAIYRGNSTNNIKAGVFCIHNSDRDILMSTDASLVDASTEAMRWTSGNDVKMANDNAIFSLGAGDDYQIYFDGTDANHELPAGATFNFTGPTDTTVAITGIGARGDTNTPSARLEFGRNVTSGTPLDNDTQGLFLITGTDDANTFGNVGAFRFRLPDVSSGNVISEIVFETLNGASVGTSRTEALTINGDDIRLPNDGAKLYLGADDDISFSYNATTSSLEVDAPSNANFVGGNGAGASLTSGTNNFIWGENAGDALTSGSDSIAIGKNALGAENTIGMIAIGRDALATNTGYYNVVVGQYAMAAGGGSGNSNSVFGFQSGYSVTGSTNSLFGYYAMHGGGSSSGNTILGYTASQYTVGNFNTSVGRAAGRLTSSGSNVTAGTSGVFIGYDARPNASGYSNEIVIGDTARGNGNNTTTIGNSSSTHFYPMGKVIANNTIRLKGYTVATLPTGTQGDTAFVTDASSPTYLATVTGSGSTVCPVFYDGTNWVAH